MGLLGGGEAVTAKVGLAFRRGGWSPRWSKQLVFHFHGIRTVGSWTQIWFPVSLVPGTYWTIQVGEAGPFWAVMEGRGRGWLSSLTARIQMKHFSSPGNPLSQALAMTTDTPAGRRQRPCHVIKIVLLTQASLWDPHSRVRVVWRAAWPVPRLWLCPGEREGELLEQFSQVRRRIPGRLSGTVSISSTAGESYPSQIKEWRTSKFRVKKLWASNCDLKIYSFLYDIFFRKC